MNARSRCRPCRCHRLDRCTSVEELVRVASVKLFLERATANHPDFALTTDNAAAIAAICRRLDGLPLAIELAAAYNVTPPAALLDRLEQRLLLLTGGSRDLPLGSARCGMPSPGATTCYPQEQTLFRRLAVFVGGWTLEASEEVANLDGTSNVLAGLETLLSASLIQSEERSNGSGASRCWRRFASLQ